MATEPTLSSLPDWLKMWLWIRKNLRWILPSYTYVLNFYTCKLCYDVKFFCYCSVLL